MVSADFFGPEGVLSGLLPGFVHNPGQERMAALVAQALDDSEALVVEAGTGTGKTFAYLVPAVESRKRVVIATATKALQEQLTEKDIPFLQDVVGMRFEAVLMKGRGNYLCRRRLETFLKNPTFEVRREADVFQQVQRWAETTETGDRAEMADLPEGLKFWDEIASHPDHCAGHRCSRHGDCFITKMRARAAGADVLIVNHHLFFADLSVRDNPNAEVIPRYEAVILDEAHGVEQVATDFFGLQVSTYRFEELERDARALLLRAGALNEAAKADIARVLEVGRGLLVPMSGLAKADGRFRLRIEHRTEAVLEGLNALAGAIGDLAKRVEALTNPDFEAEAEAIARRSLELDAHVQIVLALDDPRMVYWCERRGRGVFVTASPVDVAEDLALRLHDAIGPIVFCSATLSTGGDFAYFKKRIGLTRESIEAKIPSHFDFARQALLYVPNAMPPPPDKGFARSVAEEVRRIVTASAGRAFVLFTSYANMQRVYDLLKDELPYTCLLQGERPKSVILDEFRRDVSSVLFATTSFWQGVDVRGEALSCVVIDKIPFEVPSDPIVEARIERIRAAGGEPFGEYQIPEAIISLKQGIGRLIRDRTDRGVVTVCDVRLFTKGYGKRILKALDDYPVTRRFADVERFFGPPS